MGPREGLLLKTIVLIADALGATLLGGCATYASDGYYVHEPWGGYGGYDGRDPGDGRDPAPGGVVSGRGDARNDEAKR